MTPPFRNMSEASTSLNLVIFWTSHSSLLLRGVLQQLILQGVNSKEEQSCCTALNQSPSEGINAWFLFLCLPATLYLLSADALWPIPLKVVPQQVTEGPLASSRADVESVSILFLSLWCPLKSTEVLDPMRVSVSLLKIHQRQGFGQIHLWIPGAKNQSPIFMNSTNGKTSY